MPIKRFLLFGGYHYYPGGGWNDFIGTFDTIEGAKSHPVPDDNIDWVEIVDTETMTVAFRDDDRNNLY